MGKVMMLRLALMKEIRMSPVKIKTNRVVMRVRKVGLLLSKPHPPQIRQFQVHR